MFMSCNIGWRKTPGRWSLLVKQLRMCVSQGNAATHLRRGGIFSDDFNTNVLPGLTMKECKNQSALAILRAII